MKALHIGVLLFALLLSLVSPTFAGDGDVKAKETGATKDAFEEYGKAPAAESKVSSPPLPLHSIEGVGGVGLTEMAYLLNPSENGKWFGFPTFSATGIVAGHKSVGVFTVSETFFKRLELSYSLHLVGLGDFDKDVKDVTGAEITNNSVQMHNVNARLLLIEESGWFPAVTAGVHYKNNTSIRSIDRDLGGALFSSLGVADNDGVDYTLTATKLFKDVLPRPFFVSGTIRNTSAAQIGWLGFTDQRDTVFEGNAGVFVTDKLIVAAEYRQKPDQLQQVSGVLGKEDDWWTLAASYIVNDHTNISAAYGHLGSVVNHDEPAALWLQVKFEF